MKYFAQILALALSLAATASGAPLRKADVAADAKWVLHLDVDQLRSTSTGDFVIKEIVDKVFAEPKALIQVQTGYGLDLTNINSVTAYGDYTSNRVLLLKTDIDAEKILDGFLSKTKKEGKSEPSTGGKTVEDGLVTYTILDHVVVSVRPDKIAIVSQSVEANHKANEVLSGKAPNLHASHAFGDFADSQKAFFFLGAAEAFNASQLGGDAHDDDQNNPKAKILQMADSGRIVLGQEADQLFLDASLKAKTPAVVKQMQQVIQGMVALATLIHSDNTNIQQLAESAKVSTKGDVVTLSLNFPVDAAMEILKSNAVAHLEQHGHEHKHHHEDDAPPKSDDK